MLGDGMLASLEGLQDNEGSRVRGHVLEQLQPEQMSLTIEIRGLGTLPVECADRIRGSCFQPQHKYTERVLWRHDPWSGVGLGS